MMDTVAHIHTIDGQVEYVICPDRFTAMRFRERKLPFLKRSQAVAIYDMHQRAIVAENEDLPAKLRSQLIIEAVSKLIGKCPSCKENTMFKRIPFTKDSDGIWSKSECFNCDWLDQLTCHLDNEPKHEFYYGQYANNLDPKS